MPLRIVRAQVEILVSTALVRAERVGAGDPSGEIAGSPLCRRRLRAAERCAFVVRGFFAVADGNAVQTWHLGFLVAVATGSARRSAARPIAASSAPCRTGGRLASARSKNGCESD
jgi:hypothetical protein